MEFVIGVVQPAEDLALDMAARRPAAGCVSGWFDALFQEHYPRVVGMLARLMGDRGAAEEIAADVFSKIAGRADLPQAADMTAWVYRVAANAGLDALRSAARRRRREQEAGVESMRTAATEGALDELLRAERCARVRSVLALLKPREAQLLLLRANGLAYRELAAALGIQPASVGTLLARAEAEFERRFRARYGGDA